MASSASNYRCSVLAVDPDPAPIEALRKILDPEFYLTICRTAAEANRVIAARPIDIVIVNEQLTDQPGLQLLEQISQQQPQCVRIVAAEEPRWAEALDAVNSGRVQRCIVKPWNAEQFVQSLRLAARTHLLERSHEELLKELRTFNVELERKVHDRTMELEHANQQLHQKNLMLTRMALTDPLTGLPNRRAMDRLAKNEVVRRTRYPSPIAIALADVDFFHDINSAHLLSGGDHALVWLAQTLATAVRTVDTVGRVGGEEFMVVAPETDEEGAWILAERIRTTVESGKTAFNGTEIRLTVSVGIAVAPAGAALGYDQLRHSAAACLAEAKSSGRNRSVLKVVAGRKV